MSRRAVTPLCLSNYILRRRQNDYKGGGIFMENTKKKKKLGYVEFLSRIADLCEKCGHGLLDFSYEYEEEHYRWVLKVKTD
jgi:hypothetical protein